MSDAKATLESAIISGLSERAHITKLNADKTEILVEDIISAIFAPHFRWAIKDYLEELEKEV